MCRLRRRIFPLLAVLGAMLSTTAGCHNSDPDLISIDHEAFIHEVRGTPNALTRMSDGTLIVVGGLESAWAVALDAGGKVRWKFERSVEPGTPPSNQSVYHDAVQLVNGDLLLCGEETSKQGGHALFTLLDRGVRKPSSRCTSTKAAASRYRMTRLRSLATFIWVDLTRPRWRTLIPALVPRLFTPSIPASPHSQ
jgi:hypothetical protein